MPWPEKGGGSVGEGELHLEESGGLVREACGTGPNRSIRPCLQEDREEEEAAAMTSHLAEDRETRSHARGLELEKRSTVPTKVQ